jgi:uncharacterized membrane protein YsdA (DUF1294 family)
MRGLLFLLAGVLSLIGTTRYPELWWDWNVVALVSFGWDKLCAKFKWARTSEAALIFLSISAGPGSAVGLLFFNHKTRKAKFLVAIPIGISLYLGAEWLSIAGVQF